MDMNLEILRVARGLASHAADRQGLIAENIANADTPGYKARDLASFSEAYQGDGPGRLQLKATRLGHLQPDYTPHNAAVEVDSVFGAESPNGNTVSLEDQMMRSVAVRHQHELALGVYRKSLDILRISLGPGR
ncbi:FlgB family protein [Halovulum sp. GXIMD14793]